LGSLCLPNLKITVVLTASSSVIPGSRTTLNSPLNEDTKSAKLRPQDHLLVFYVPDKNQWEAGRAQMISAGFHEVPSYNPYWDLQGKTFEDIDGYRVVLQNAPWTE